MDLRDSGLNVILDIGCSKMSPDIINESDSNKLLLLSSIIKEHKVYKRLSSRVLWAYVRRDRENLEKSNMEEKAEDHGGG